MSDQILRARYVGAHVAPPSLGAWICVLSHTVSHISAVGTAPAPAPATMHSSHSFLVLFVSFLVIVLPFVLVFVAIFVLALKCKSANEEWHGNSVARWSPGVHV